MEMTVQESVTATPKELFPRSGKRYLARPVPSTVSVESNPEISSEPQTEEGGKEKPVEADLTQPEESGPYVRTPLAFEAIRDALVSSPVLAHPDFAKQFTVEVDTSDYAVGAMLAQAYDEEKPLALKPGAYATLSRLERSSDQPVWEHDYDVVDQPEIPEIPRGSIDRLTLTHTRVGWIEEQHQDSFCAKVFQALQVLEKTPVTDLPEMVTKHHSLSEFQILEGLLYLVSCDTKSSPKPATIALVEPATTVAEAPIFFSGYS
jgi:hypothetical protein